MSDSMKHLEIIRVCWYQKDSRKLERQLDAPDQKKNSKERSYSQGSTACFAEDTFTVSYDVNYPLWI